MELKTCSEKSSNYIWSNLEEKPLTPCDWLRDIAVRIVKLYENYMNNDRNFLWGVSIHAEEKIWTYILWSWFLTTSNLFIYTNKKATIYFRKLYWYFKLTLLEFIVLFHYISVLVGLVVTYHALSIIQMIILELTFSKLIAQLNNIFHYLIPNNDLFCVSSFIIT